MQLRVLGCHGGETPRHRTSSFLVGEHFALDAGAITSTLTLEEQQAIHCVLVSHAHLDHVRDLATLADNRCQQGGRGIEIVGTPVTLEALRQHFFNDLLWPDFSRIHTDGQPTIRYRTIDPMHPTEVAGHQVTAIPVNHTVDASAFILSDAQGAIAYSGDTGPTDLLWQQLNQQANLRALIMEVSFPNAHHRLAALSGHHTPESLAGDLRKLHDQPHLPLLMFHIKPVFEAEVERELSALQQRDLAILRLGELYNF